MDLSRRRLRRCFRWPSLILTLVILAAYITSARWAVYIRTSHGNGVGLWPGRLAIERNSWHIATAVVVPRSWLGTPAPNPPSPQSPRDESTFRFSFEQRRLHNYRAWFIPLWWPLTPAMVFAAALWSPELISLITRIGRTRPGHCPCGYDLTGNTTGICPECGRPNPASARSFTDIPPRTRSGSSQSPAH